MVSNQDTSFHIHLLACWNHLCRPSLMILSLKNMWVATMKKAFPAIATHVWNSFLRGRAASRGELLDNFSPVCVIHTVAGNPSFSQPTIPVWPPHGNLAVMLFCPENLLFILALTIFKGFSYNIFYWWPVTTINPIWGERWQRFFKKPTSLLIYSEYRFPPGWELDSLYYAFCVWDWWIRIKLVSIHQKSEQEISP